MTTLYKNSEVTGTEYLRARMVEVHNQLGVLPHVAFIEERVTLLPGRTITAVTGTLSQPYSADAVIDLLDPETQEPLGATMTMGQIMVALYSMYIALAVARDGPAVVEEPPVEEPPVEEPPVEGGA